MILTRGRVIRHEVLDEQPPEIAAECLRDLVRINKRFGGHEVLRTALRRIVNPSDGFTILDVGAASGDMGQVVCQEYSGARVTSLDYKAHHLLAAEPPKVAADAFQLPFRPASFDIVHCSLFLHHFENSAVIELLRCFGRVARKHVIVTDLERHLLSYYFLPATRWLFRWHPVTLHDGPISVAAAFKAKELRQLALAAGLQDVYVSVHRPAFRLCLTASAGSNSRVEQPGRTSRVETGMI